MFFDSKKKNRLEELTTRLDAAIQGVKTGKDLVLYYSAEEGNTAKSLSDFEADIRSKIEAGGPQNVNARGFADYLKKLHAQIPSKLTYAYLKEKGFLTQFGIHWKINTGEKNSTKTQEILSKEDPKALEAFKKVIQTHLDTTFILEKIKNGSAFEGMEKYLASQKVPNDKIQVVLQLLKKPGNGEANSIYMALLAMKLPSEVTEEELQKISELAAQ